MRYAESVLTLAGLVLGSVFAQQVAFAQGRGSTAVGSSQGVGAVTQPGSDGTVVEHGWYLTGKVVMDDGTAPPDSVAVQRVCGGFTTPVAYTDSKGRFSTQSQGDVLPDASVGSGEQGRVALMAPIGMSTQEGRLFGSAGERHMAGCQLVASLPGYHSDTVEIGQRRYLDNPDVGTIVLHRLGDVEGTSISATSYDAPRDAKRAYDKGLDEEKKSRWKEAQAQFEKAVAAYPRYAAAWFELGNAFQRQGDKPKARSAYVKSIQADQRFLRPYFPLSVMAFDDQKWAETASVTATLTKLDPVDFPLAFLLNAIANSRLGNLEIAERSAREAVRLDTSHQLPRAEYVLGLILADRRDYDGSLAALKSYIQRAPNVADSANIKKQITQIESARAQLHPTQPGAAAPQQ